MTTPYHNFSIEQLHSALSERDDQLRVALSEVEGMKLDICAVDDIRRSPHASQERCKELEAHSNEAAELIKEFMADLTTHKTVLKECGELFRAVSLHGFGRTQHNALLKLYPTVTALLENTKPQFKPPESKGIGMYELAKEHRECKQESKSLLPGLREAWRILNVAPEEELAFKVGRLMERIKELETK